MSEFQVKIVGSAEGLESAANTAAGILDGFSSGSVSSASDAISGLMGKMGTMGIAAGAALAALSALVAGGASLAIEYNKLSKEFGVNIEQIQKMEKAYSSASLEAEKLLDINKDASEKLGEAWNEGTGEFISALNLIKADIKDYAAFTNDPEGGRKAAEMWYYQAQAAGLARSEIIAGMEMIASDASKMIGVLEQSSDYWEHQNRIASQSVYISEEVAQSWGDASNKLINAGKETMGWFAEFFDFIPKGFNTIYDYFDKDFTNTDFYLTFKAVSSFIIDQLPPLFDKAKVSFSNAITPIINMFSSVQDTLVSAYNKFAEILAAIQNAIRKAGKSTIEFFGFDAGFLDFEIPAITTDYIKSSAKSLGNAIETSISEAITGQAGSSFDAMIEIERKKLDAERAALAAENKANTEKMKQEHEKQSQAALAKACKICGKGNHSVDDCPETKKSQDAAKKAADNAKKLRDQAYKDLEAINIALYSQSEAAVASSNKQIVDNLAKLDNALKQGLITQEQYEEKRRSLIDANAENFRKSVLGASPVDALQMLDASREIYEKSVSDLETMFNNKLITESDYLQRKQALEDAYNARNGASNGLADRKFNELSSAIGGFAFGEDFDNQKAQADAQYQTDIDNINKAGLPEEQRMKLLEQAERKHKNTLIDIERDAANARMSIVSDMFGGMTSALQMFGLENTRIGTALFAAQKGAAIAQATIDTYAAANKALNSAPPPLSYALAAGAVAKGLANVAQIKSMNLTGMAHDGIDNVPREGTWLLQKGERVVDDRTNGDLKDFLSAQKSNNSSGNKIEVHAPLQITGNVNSSDKMVMDAIKRHPQFVAQAVQDAQRRKM
ncbi:SHOCT domain-containing protein [Providencia sp. JUb39]|uniref:SHOCT domain-containing protein n=1 Tax=Providencia sp. JUb39 TaxID=2724165 RepID=UPI00164D762E|nr:SHOCT domain-containing protein [Providencia sp. JUb39]MBC5790606.1 SHOCT domain-containing protein [Providencia sp. JUb39]